jgi:hypothetical protein
MSTKTSNELTLFDALSRLTFAQAATLLGTDGRRLIRAGGAYDIDLETAVELERDRFRVRVDGSTVTVTMHPAARRRLHLECDRCDATAATYRASTPARRCHSCWKRSWRWGCRRCQRNGNRSKASARRN